MYFLIYCIENIFSYLIFQLNKFMYFDVLYAAKFIFHSIYVLAYVFYSTFLI